MSDGRDEEYSRAGLLPCLVGEWYADDVMDHEHQCRCHYPRGHTFRHMCYCGSLRSEGPKRSNTASDRREEVKE